MLFLRRDGTVRAAQKLSETTGGAVGPFQNGDEWNPTACLGDLDGDGFSDLVFGSRLSDMGGVRQVIGQCRTELEAAAARW